MPSSSARSAARLAHTNSPQRCTSPRGVQAFEAVLHLNGAADLQLQLSRRPWALLLADDEEREDRVFAGLPRWLAGTLLLHGKDHPFRATASGSLRCAGANY